MAKEIEFMFSNGTVTREILYKNGSGDEILVEIYWKYYGGTLVIDNDDNFELENLLKNENSEWKSHRFIPPEEEFPDLEITLEPEKEDFEDILIEQDIDLVDEKLKEDGYQMVSDQMKYEDGPLQLVK